MTALRVSRRFTFAPAPRPKRASKNQLSGWKTARAFFLLSLLFAVTAIAAPAQSFTTLWNFGGFAASPDTPLVQGTDGNFYGVTFRGGTYDWGTVFKVTPGGKLTILHVFCPQNFQPLCTDGGFPSGGLVQATDGNLYGTAEILGTHGDGTVFKITPAGKLTTVYGFCSQTNCADGVFPGGELVQGTDGNFYGITLSGIGGQAGGTVFRVTPSGTQTTLHSFCTQQGCPDGANPSGLVQATDGNLYGTTSGGGTNGYGTVFKISPEGKMTTLHSFVFSDGGNPSGLMQAIDGNLYGTTTLGGGTNGGGTVFKITPGGTLTTLHTFNGSDGAGPSAGLVQATDGNFYGTTAKGEALPVEALAAVRSSASPRASPPSLVSFATQGRSGRPHKFSGKDSLAPREFPSTQRRQPSRSTPTPT